MIWLRLKEAQELNEAFNKALGQLYTAEGYHLDHPKMGLEYSAILVSLVAGHPVLVEGVVPVLAKPDGGYEHLLTRIPDIPKENANEAGIDSGTSASGGGDQDHSEGDKGADRKQDKRRFVHPL